MRNIVLSLVMLFGSFIGFSQVENVDTDKKIKFGFNIGTNYSNLVSKESFTNNSEIYNGFGLITGIIMDYNLTDNLLISPKAELSFNKSGIETISIDEYSTTYKVFSTSIDLMTHLVYKIGSGKISPYLLLGPKLSIPLYEKTLSSTKFRNSANFSIDFGFGLENKLQYFFFSPEIRYSYGLVNINKNPSFQTLNYHKISLVLNFK